MPAVRPAAAADPVIATGVSSRPRYLAIDVLRGLTIAGMIMVNNNGDPRAFAVMHHAAWNGFTPTDLVFPTFLFLVGVSIVLSTEGRLARGVARNVLLLQAMRRTVILFLLGLVVNSFPFFRLETMRFYGVLPRIALCYLIVTTLYLFIRQPDGSPAGRATVGDKIAFIIVSLVGYYLLMRVVPVPGAGVPGRDIPLLDHDANLAAWLDRALFSAQHLYERTRDPEGLLSTIPALATTWLGVLTGLFLTRSTRDDASKALRLAVAGLVCVVLGALWDPWFPINKKLWTSSYVLYAGGWSLLLLAACWYLTQARGWRRGTTFLLVFGTNAITAYVISELISPGLSHVMVAPDVDVMRWWYLQLARLIPSAPVASLAYSVLYMLLCWALVYPLYRSKIFIRV